ncbi:ribosome silencing factor [bacterium]|nr:MAG: ribosome silencing factor [bacterium]
MEQQKEEIEKKSKSNSQRLAHYCAERLHKKHAENIYILDLRELTDITDFFVIASANSSKHLEALADELMEIFKDAKINNYHIEGLEALKWVLADAYDVIIHLFLSEVREYYDIESYWGDAPVEIIQEST